MADLMINVSQLLTFACAYDIIDHTIRPRIPWRYVAVTVARGYLYVDKTAGQKESEVFMKKVLLLGDSIRMGYQSEVKKLLENEYEVMYPEDNGRFAAYTLWQVNQAFKWNPDIALVHFNNGYWDMNIESPMTEAIHPVKEYQSFLRRIVELCHSCGATVVFATTVPILEEGSANDNTGTMGFIHYSNEWVKEYNAAAIEVMNEMGVVVNDLYTLCMEDERRYKCADLLHLSDEGSRRCAAQVADYIRKYAEGGDFSL